LEKINMAVIKCPNEPELIKAGLVLVLQYKGGHNYFSITTIEKITHDVGEGEIEAKGTGNLVGNIHNNLHFSLFFNTQQGRGDIDIDIPIK
jgi:hypothetical protein